MEINVTALVLTAVVVVQMVLSHRQSVLAIKVLGELKGLQAAAMDQMVDPSVDTAGGAYEPFAESETAEERYEREKMELLKEDPGAAEQIDRMEGELGISGKRASLGEGAVHNADEYEADYARMT